MNSKRPRPRPTLRAEQPRTELPDLSVVIAFLDEMTKGEQRRPKTSSAELDGVTTPTAEEPPPPKENPAE